MNACTRNKHAGERMGCSVTVRYGKKNVGVYNSNGLEVYNLRHA